MTPGHSAGSPDQEAVTGSVDFTDPKLFEELQGPMLKFARLQLNDPSMAEDMVQEAFIGALKNARHFAGRSAFKTWMFAILKNKISDHLRKRYHQFEMTQSEADPDTSKLPFDESGHWRHDTRPSHWGNPEQDHHSNRFWHVFETCLNVLPGRQGKVFMMREYLELSSAEICESESISLNNLHIVLYRARMRLQQCLNMNWYEGESP